MADHDTADPADDWQYTEETAFASPEQLWRIRAIEAEAEVVRLRGVVATLTTERDEARKPKSYWINEWVEAVARRHEVEADRERLIAALTAQSNAYGCYAGCTGALPGAPADGSGHTPNCKQARAALVAASQEKTT